MIEFIFCHLKNLCDAIRFIRHKVGAYKICPITIIVATSYSNQIVYI